MVDVLNVFVNDSIKSSSHLNSTSQVGHSTNSSAKARTQNCLDRVIRIHLIVTINCRKKIST